ncbi:hypothetical protein TanjilG_06821 [Lupinus angustifolius]|uniref:non-specific serine/threonine protein kinase n=1 Tax=Lupinus angustifolius TaxID=3871 RepID=A0A1J7G5Q7_LUPAN|nr:PREDICTED: probable serine/threonine-protein kinase PBL7 [Lupinus angustifolius]OIV95845.1 hypothetical protein TanjilG_06821 [Lupinus angustifolius]
MSCCLPCCKSEVESPSYTKVERKTRKVSAGRQTFKSIAAAVSIKTGSSRHRHITAEILKYGAAQNDVKVFTYEELAAATGNFSTDCRIGEGGFGNVYKGYIKSTNQTVAVKQLNREGTQGTREFFAEVLMLSLVKHPNLVKLLGYCAEEDNRILVYECMANGSLEDHLLDMGKDKEPLDWQTRMKIAEGAVRGLEYLHNGADPPVIFRDFKSSNILLDENFNAKLSDFGLAKLGPIEGKNPVSTRVMGTYGYCAPEYASSGQLSTKIDIYSFGVVLLEIITGRRVIDTARCAEEQNLIDWATPLFKDRKKFTQMADPLLEGNFPVKGLFQALAVAAMCLQEEPDMRPQVDDVVTALMHLTTQKNEEKDIVSDSLKSEGHVESFRATPSFEEPMD